MEKKFIIFIVIAGLILYLSNSFLVNKNQIKTPAIATTASGKVSSENSESTKYVQSEQLIKPAEIKEATIENEALKIVITSKGAKISSVFVKKIDNIKKIEEKVNLIDQIDENKNLSMSFNLNSVFYELDKLNWNIEKKDEAIESSIEPISGVIVSKIIKLNTGFDAQLILSIKNKTANELKIENLKIFWGPGKNSGSSQYNVKKIVVLTEKALEITKSKKRNEINIHPMKKGWIGMSDQYFCSIFYANPGIFKSVEVRNNENQTLEMAFELPEVYVKPGEMEQKVISCYFGPQNYQLLSKYDHYLNKIVDFGFFKVISIPLYHVLKYFYRMTSNYGVAIILLTILIRAILWWPTQKSYGSMKKMQSAMSKMQPRLKTLKEIYRDNPAKLNEETMKLYKEYQINPMGGCLPMILQMPVFFALYSTLISSVELRGASFAWFWKDLSVKDPYGVLPVLMGLSMFLQQKMSTPPAATPEAAVQQKMMLYFMPIMLTFFAFMWPSGLLLYWVVSNILSIAQQMIINRKEA